MSLSLLMNVCEYWDSWYFGFSFSFLISFFVWFTIRLSLASLASEPDSMLDRFCDEHVGNRPCL